jgi:hypothetical protein
MDYRLTNSRRAKITQLTADGRVRVEQGDHQGPGGGTQPFNFSKDIPKQPQTRLPESKQSISKDTGDNEDNIGSMLAGNTML